jgi:hypothetical protein
MPNILDLQKLNPLDPNDFKKIEIEIKDVLLSENLGYIEEVLDYLSEVLQNRGPEIESKSPQLYESYQNYWINLAFSSFVSLDVVDQDNLLKTRVFYAVESGYDLNYLLKQFYLFFESDEFIKELFRNFSKSLEQNSEQFGTMPIEFEGRKMLPTLKYWIMDYSKFPSKVSKRGSVERLNYINQSTNTRSLTQVNRQILLKILKFYDDLLNGERPVVQVNKSRSRIAPPELRQKSPSPVSVPSLPSPIVPNVNIQKKLDELKMRSR